MIILVDLKGFTLAHNIYRIENDKVTAVSPCSIKNMPEMLCEIAYSHQNVEKIILSGNKKFTSDIKNRIRGTFFAKCGGEFPFEIEQR